MSGLTKAQLEEKLLEKDKEIESYRKAFRENEERISRLESANEEAYMNSSVYKQQQQRIEILEKKEYISKKEAARLKEHIRTLEKENGQLRERIKNPPELPAVLHNARGAGRIPKPEEKTVQQAHEIERLRNEGRKEKEICAEMGISRTTYYRIKKCISTSN